MERPSWPEVIGPLEPYAPGYREELLSGLGYSRWAASAHMYLMAHVSTWLADQGVAPDSFDSTRVAEFLADRRASGHVRRLTPRGLIPLRGYLLVLGVFPADPAAVPDDPVGRLVAEYGQYLSGERGLAPATIAGYQRVARRFLVSCAPDPAVPGCGVERLGGELVDAFLLSTCVRGSVGTANNVVTALRSLLRFFELRGYTVLPLADCVPQAAPWRDRGGSRALAPSEVARLLASCDRRTASGRRDFAILTVLARLGLRAGEVASLSLDDIDWDAGEFVVTGKGGRRDRLPLPGDVGQALAGYCQRGRPRNGHRAVFLQVRAPYGPLSRDAISYVVLRACRRAGLEPMRVHLLRHASASAMRRAGAPLFEIGQVLRHRWAATSAGYAKDDLEALAALARPWPGARS